jgi:hypothetical protein
MSIRKTHHDNFEIKSYTMQAIQYGTIRNGEILRSFKIHESGLVRSQGVTTSQNLTEWS